MSKSVEAYVAEKRKLDGWKNIAAGLGTEKDARTYSTVSWRIMGEFELEELYAGDPIAARIVDLPVDYATEKGYRVTGVKPDQEDAIRKKLQELYFNEAVYEAAKTARLKGGACILKVYDDSLELNKPVNKNAPKPLKALVVFPRHELFVMPGDVQTDILSTERGKPVYYTYEGGDSFKDLGLKIHYSRMVRFDGVVLPRRLHVANNYWGDSVLSRPYDAIRNYSFAHDGVNAAVKDLSTGVFKIKHLADQVGANDDAAVIGRLQMVNLTKSMVRAVVLDADGEDFDYKTRALTGAGELVDKAEARLAAETGIPKTVLLGTSPQGGMGQSGNHESDNWYSFVEAYQTNYLKPHMLEIIKDVCAELNIDAEKVEIEFNPLWQMSEKEQVEMRNKQADTDSKYYDIGVADAVELRKSRFGGDKYSIETSVEGDLPANVAMPIEEEVPELAPAQEEAPEAKEPKAKVAKEKV